jgi:hypothetical protein
MARVLDMTPDGSRTKSFHNEILAIIALMENFP